MIETQKLITVIKYCGVGASGILVNESVLIILKEFIKIILPVASIIAIELSILNNFIWNDNWTFKNRTNSVWKRLLTFHLICIMGSVINFIVLNVLSQYIDYRLANLIGIGISFGWNIILNWRITWKAN